MQKRHWNNKDLEKVVGLQTDKPLKRAFMPYGGIKMAEQSCQMYGYTPSPKLHEIFTKYHKTHNQGVFDIYTPEMKLARHNKILTGLPDTYGRGRIVGDYRRVALYGIDRLIEGKKEDFAETNRQGTTNSRGKNSASSWSGLGSDKCSCESSRHPCSARKMIVTRTGRL